MEPGSDLVRQAVVGFQLQEPLVGEPRQVGAPRLLGELPQLQERNPDNAEAFLQLGQLAEQAGRTDLARLAYQRFLQLQPDDRLADEVRARLKELA